MVANVYVDGFNLYYGRLKKNPAHKWLDLVELCRSLLPAGQELRRVRYFTARITPRPGDPGPANRQDAYLRALGSLPEVSIHYGRFSQGPTRMWLAEPPPGGPNTVEVIKTEEKGSDVNLGAHMLLDAFRKDCDLAVLVSNDSDLCEPLRMVRDELGIDVGILNPCSQPSRWLQKVKPAFIKPIRAGAVAASQLPDPVVLPNGAKVVRPSEWTVGTL